LQYVRQQKTKMTFRLSRLFLATSIAGICLAAICALRAQTIGISWRSYDRIAVERALQDGENVIVYFRGNPRYAHTYPCNPENTFFFRETVEFVRQNKVICFLADAFVPGSPAEKMRNSIDGKERDFVIAFYCKGDDVPVVYDCSTRYWKQMRDRLEARVIVNANTQIAEHLHGL
jgi:hypothetical protein